jgi:hypothetical protein
MRPCLSGGGDLANKAQELPPSMKPRAANPPPLCTAARACSRKPTWADSDPTTSRPHDPTAPTCVSRGAPGPAAAPRTCSGSGRSRACECTDPHPRAYRRRVRCHDGINTARATAQRRDGATAQCRSCHSHAQSRVLVWRTYQRIATRGLQSTRLNSPRTDPIPAPSPRIRMTHSHESASAPAELAPAVFTAARGVTRPVARQAGRCAFRSLARG